MCRLYRWLCVLCVSSFWLAPTSSRAEVLLRESFGGLRHHRDLNDLAGWSFAVSDGAAVGGRGRQFSRVNRNVLSGERGLVFHWHDESGARAVLSWMSEDGGRPLRLSRDQLRGFRMRLGHGGAENESRFAVRVETAEGPRWFVSAEAFAHQIGSVEAFDAESRVVQFTVPEGETGWVELAFDGRAVGETRGFAVLGTGRLENGGGALPPGPVTAVGVYDRVPRGPASRFTDFELLAEVVSAGTVAFAVPELRVPYDALSIEVPLERRGSGRGEALVSVRSVDGSARQQVDFVPLDVELLWEEGDTERRVVRITPMDNPSARGKRFFVELHSPGIGVTLAEPSRIAVLLE